MSGPRALVDIVSTPPPWRTWPETEAVLTALDKVGGTARFVGGCVRDALLGLSTTDIDICTDLKPEDVVAALESVQIRAIPTGIDHGTITAVLGEHSFEITTLRVDVISHGRHADVAFTGDWKQDAARRDFTVNAIYLDRNGEIFDPAGGLNDLQAGKIRFIGKAEDRIREDRLRVLRYFRFFARLGEDKPDPEALEACRAAAGQLDKLSIERIRKELLLLLATNQPFTSVQLMAETGVLTAILEQEPDLGLLRSLLSLPVGSDEIQRLAALLGGAQSPIEATAERLKFSNRQKKRLAALSGQDVSENLPPQDRATALYQLGAEAFADQALLLWARDPKNSEFTAYLEDARNWSAPIFPVAGADLLDRGMESGPELGRQLKELESEWINSGFTASKADLLKRLT